MQQTTKNPGTRLRLESSRRSRPHSGRPDEVSTEMMILGMALGILMLALARSLS